MAEGRLVRFLGVGDRLKTAASTQASRQAQEIVSPVASTQASSSRTAPEVAAYLEEVVARLSLRPESKDKLMAAMREVRNAVLHSGVSSKRRRG